MQETLADITFQKMFVEQNISAVNHAIPGGTNIDTVNMLKKNHNYDLLIVFQTDPIRQCLDNDKLKIKSGLHLPYSNNFDELCELLLRDFYLELKKINRPMLLIGGCTKLCFKYVPANIKTLDKSWTELLVPDFQDNYYYWTEPALCLFNYARKYFNWKVGLSDFFEFEKQILSKNYVWQNSDKFSWCHASELGYKIMFDKINGVLNDYS